MELEILTALITVIPTTVIAIASVFITLYLYFANRKETTEPKVSLEKITFDPRKLKVYAPSYAGWKGSEPIPDNAIKTIVQKTANSVCKEFIGEKEYVIINLLPRNSPYWKDAIILENVLQVELKNHRGYITELKIIRAYAQLYGMNELIDKLSYNVSLYPDERQRIHFNITYIFKQGQGTSINAEGIKQYIKQVKRKKCKEIVLDVKNTRNLDKVSSLISFYDSGYLAKCYGLRQAFHVALRMQIVSSLDDEKRILKAEGIPDRRAKKEFRSYRREVKRNMKGRIRLAVRASGLVAVALIALGMGLVGLVWLVSALA
jgi:hypothetical protein